MKKVDIVILTESRYVNPAMDDVSAQVVVKEDFLLIGALEQLGLTTARVDWNDKNFNWSSSRFAVFRSTWDYFYHFKKFKNWLNKANKLIHFINPIELILWNLDKHYLMDLAEHEINIPETVFIEANERTSLTELFERTGWKEAILKPAISGTARHTYRLTTDDLTNHEEQFQQLIAVESMLLQQFQKSILRRGEISLVFLAGTYSHAVIKKARAGDFRVQNNFGGTVQLYKPTKNEILLAIKCLSVCPSMPLYARVDIIDDNLGQPAIAELELIEPELWFRLKPKAANDMAAAIRDFVRVIE